MKHLKRMKFFMVVFMLMVIVTVLGLNTKHVQASDYIPAKTLKTDGSWSSDYWLTDEEDEQWYKIVIPSDGKLSYKTIAYTGLYCSLYTEDLSKKIAGNVNGGSGTATSPMTRTEERSLSKGIYYLKVNSAFNCTGKYKISVSFTSYQTNDAYAVSYDSPQKVCLNSQITGAITETDLEDWYRISIPASKNYRYQITSYFRVYFTLYNEDLSKEIASTHGVCIGGSETSPGTETYDIDLAKGTYYLKIKPEFDTGKYKFTVKNKILTVNKSKITLYKGKSTIIKTSTSPTAKITYKSSNTKIATVNSKGKITAKKKGTCKIIVKANGITKTIKVTVKNPVLKVSKDSVTLKMKKSYTIKTTVQPSAKVTFKSSNKKIATVNSKGKVTAKKRGTCKIIVKANGITKSVSIKVK